jgi:hypothetical protein
MDNTCGKTKHMRTMDRGFTVLHFTQRVDCIAERKTTLLSRHYLSKGFPVVDLSMISYGDDEVSKGIIIAVALS